MTLFIGNAQNSKLRGRNQLGSEVTGSGAGGVGLVSSGKGQRCACVAFCVYQAPVLFAVALLVLGYVDLTGLQSKCKATLPTQLQGQHSPRTGTKLAPAC